MRIYFVLLSLVILLAKEKVLAQEDLSGPESRDYQIACTAYYCHVGLQNCISSKCYGPQCSMCMTINLPVCSMCTDALNSKENYLNVEDDQYLKCEVDSPMQRSACDFFCRSRFKPAGECVTLLGHSVCSCFKQNVTEVSTPAPGVTTTTPVVVTVTATQPPVTQPSNPNFGKLDSKLIGHKDTVWSLAVLTNGLLVSGSSDKTIRVWDPATATHVRTLTNHADSVYSLAVLKDGRFASGSADNTIVIWSSYYTPIATLHGHTGPVNTLTVLPNGDLSSGSDDKTVRIWDMTTYKPKRTLTGHTRFVTSLVVSSNGLLLSGSDDGSINIWNDNQNTPVGTMKDDRSSPIFALANLNNNRIAAGCFKNSEVRIWNSINQRSDPPLLGHAYPVSAFATLKNGDYASGSSDRLIHIRDRDTNALKTVIKGSVDAIEALVTLPDGRLASASGSVISIWNTL